MVSDHHYPVSSRILHTLSRSILHSEDAYTDPMAFKPERFLNEDGSLNQTVLDPDAAAFGFGRRFATQRWLLRDFH